MVQSQAKKAQSKVYYLSQKPGISVDKSPQKPIFVPKYVTFVPKIKFLTQFRNVDNYFNSMVCACRIFAPRNSKSKAR